MDTRQLSTEFLIEYLFLELRCGDVVVDSIWRHLREHRRQLLFFNSLRKSVVDLLTAAGWKSELVVGMADRKPRPHVTILRNTSMLCKPFVQMWCDEREGPKIRMASSNSEWSLTWFMDEWQLWMREITVTRMFRDIPYSTTVKIKNENCRELITYLLHRIGAPMETWIIAPFING
jgi:hypothetical protein